MKTQKTLLVFISLIVSMLFITSVTYAGFSIRLEKDVPMSELSGVPNNVTFNIYDSETAPTPVALQTFTSGEWSADYNFSKFTILPQDMVRFKVDFSNTDTLTRDMELWGEIELDGVVKGVREQIENEAWALFSNDTKWKENGSDIYFNDGNVGIGTTVPWETLTVDGTIRVEPTDDRRGIEIRTNGQVEIANFIHHSGPGATLVVGNYEGGTGPGLIVEYGNVGIGMTSPETIVDINTGSYSGIGCSNSLRLHNSWRGLSMGVTPEGGTIQAQSGTTGKDLYLNPDGGNVGIGTTTPQGTLDVNGTIYQRGGLLHADYMFEPDYKLESIEEHAKHMWNNKHLKAVPKAKLDEKGQEIIEVGAHRRGIVEELEKAHIYIEQLHKHIKAHEERLVKLEASLKTEISNR